MIPIELMRLGNVGAFKPEDITAISVNSKHHQKQPNFRIYFKSDLTVNIDQDTPEEFEQFRKYYESIKDLNGN